MPLRPCLLTLPVLSTSQSSLLARVLRSLLLACLCAGVCAGLLAGRAAAAAPLMLDSANGGRVEVAGHADLLIDRTQALSFAEVSDPRYAARFAPLEGELNEGLLRATVWLRFAVQRPAGAPAEWWLETQPATIEHLSLYVPQGGNSGSGSGSGSGGAWEPRDSGLAVPFTQREVQYRNPVFKLRIPADAPAVFYVRVASRNNLAMRLTLWQPDAFLSAVALEQVMLGLYLGVFAMLVLASFWFELAVRDGIYKAFGIYVASCILLTLGDTGLLYQYGFPAHPEWAEPALGLAFALSVPTCIDFLFRFIGMPQRYPRLSLWYIRVVRLYAAALAVAIMAGYAAAAVGTVSVVATFVLAPLTFAILLKPAWNSTNEIRIAFFSTGVLLFVGLAVRFLLDMGYLERNALTEYSAFLSLIVFFLIVYYAKSRRYYSMREAKDIAQDKLLAMSRHAELELEKQVGARTEELVSAMKIVENALSQERSAHEEQRQFIATVSHELRTPLAVIDATVQNLTREATAPTSSASPRTRTRLEKIQQATDRLSSLFDNYLSNNRLDVLSHGIHAGETPLPPLLTDAVDSAQALADKHVFDIVEPVPPTIWADPHFLRLVLRTLVDNAAKYTPPGARVRIIAAVVRDGWQIEVADTGAGIAAEEQELIFDRYYRGRSSAGHAGTGLGLPLARRLIEMHGGTLRLRHSDGRGSVFSIWLPAAPVRPFADLRAAQEAG